MAGNTDLFLCAPLLIGPISPFDRYGVRLHWYSWRTESLSAPQCGLFYWWSLALRPESTAGYLPLPTDAGAPGPNCFTAGGWLLVGWARPTGDQQSVLELRLICRKIEAPAASTAKRERFKGQGFKGSRNNSWGETTEAETDAVIAVVQVPPVPGGGAAAPVRVTPRAAAQQPPSLITPLLPRHYHRWVLLDNHCANGPSTIPTRCHSCLSTPRHWPENTLPPQSFADIDP